MPCSCTSRNRLQGHRALKNTKGPSAFEVLEFGSREEFIMVVFSVNEMRLIAGLRHAGHVANNSNTWVAWQTGGEIDSREM